MNGVFTESGNHEGLPLQLTLEYNLFFSYEYTPHQRDQRRDPSHDFRRFYRGVP
jgi:hypothetical protein